MKKTTKKLSLGMKIASVLACLAIVSVGFASWWIVNYPKPVEHTDGSFEVYAVQTKNIYFKDIAWGDENDAATNAMIIFGHSNTTHDTKGWFGYGDGVQPQDLSAELEFTLTVNGETNDAIKDYINKVYVDFTPETVNTFKSLITSQYIAAPTLSYSLDGGNTWSAPVAYGGTETDAGTGTMTFEILTTNMTTSSQAIKVKFTFDWGEHFNDTTTGNNLNPFDFYYGKAYDDYKDDAATVMAAINDNLTNQNYSVKIHSDPYGTATAPVTTEAAS